MQHVQARRQQQRDAGPGQPVRHVAPHQEPQQLRTGKRMNSHKHAALTPIGRALLVSRVL
ncbi:MAG: hypothetical protein EON92_16655, partial [Burkholderiales bacterium]